MRTRRSGLTMVELLVVVGIIALLIGILIPAMSMVKRTAKEVKQKAQFAAIDLGLVAFKNDYGDYPPSDAFGTDPTYSGAQRLAEAMVGWDLMGFHPNSAWQADGLAGPTGSASYDPGRVRTHVDSVTDRVVADTLSERKDRYVELAMANAFRLGDSAPGVGDGLFPDCSAGYAGRLDEDTYVLCDVFNVSERRVRLLDGSSVSPGTPILYYRANTSRKFLAEPAEAAMDSSLAQASIYNARDNGTLVRLGQLADWNKPLGDRRVHPLRDFSVFYEFITDPKVQIRTPAQVPTRWPYKPDSYILISAGYDGLYGTADDICNFSR